MQFFSIFCSRKSDFFGFWMCFVSKKRFFSIPVKNFHIFSILIISGVIKKMKKN